MSFDHLARLAFWSVHVTCICLAFLAAAVPDVVREPAFWIAYAFAAAPLVFRIISRSFWSRDDHPDEDPGSC